MAVTANTQAVLLLTAHFSKASTGDVRPLTPKEWGRFALWLKDQGVTPEDLIVGRPEEKLANWSDPKITVDRIIVLLNRGSALALAMEKWLRAGLWVITRSDLAYPQQFKKMLKTDSPALLFGVGNCSLLNKGGLAVIGSRNANEEDLSFSQALGMKAAAAGLSIISGGARGVDEAAMLGALDAEGTAIGVLADSLLKAASSVKYRRHLMNDNLVLVSPFYPEAGFHAGNAMQRNKYIYCLAGASVAVQSGISGGTWTGAIENLKKDWVPLWVKKNQDIESGNEKLVAKGGNWVSADINKIDIDNLFERSKVISEESKGLFDIVADGSNKIENEKSHVYGQINNLTLSGDLEIKDISSDKDCAIIDDETPIDSRINEMPISFYEYFLIKVEDLCTEKSMTVDDMVEAMEVNKTQINIWLKQAVADKVLKKLSKPIRYVVASRQQKSLFDT